MTLQITVPSDKIALIVDFIRKATQSKTLNVPVFFTSRGLHAVSYQHKSYVDFVRFFVPVSLDLGTNQFCIGSNDLSLASKADSDVVFSFVPSINVSENEPANRKWDEMATMCYTECHIPKQLQITARGDDTDIESLYEVPTQTMESTKFLSSLTTGLPFIAKSRKDATSTFCIDGDNIVALDGYRMLVMNNVDVPTFGDSSFLLHYSLTSFLPKSGTCRMGVLEKAQTGGGVIENKYCLYIELPDYCMWITCRDGEFPRWRKIRESPDFIGEGVIHQLHIDKRDADAFLKHVKGIPESASGSHIVVLNIIDGRLCVDSCSPDTPNVRFRFSEFTTGSITSPTAVECAYIQSALPFATDVQQREVNKIAGALLFKSEDKAILVMHCSMGKTKPLKPISCVIELQEHWTLEKSVKKPAAKKSVIGKQLGSLFVNVDKDRITILQNENEQLQKTIIKLQSEVDGLYRRIEELNQSHSF